MAKLADQAYVSAPIRTFALSSLILQKIFYTKIFSIDRSSALFVSGLAGAMSTFWIGLKICETVEKLGNWKPFCR